MGGLFSLDATDWAAIITADAPEEFGAAIPASDIPAAFRRRLPPFSRDVLRCGLPLLRAHPDAPVIYAASHGDMASTVTLLTDLGRNEVLSPAKFAMSVHNAPTGALALSLGQAGDDTALAADEASLAAALTEAYARLGCDAEQVLLILAEGRLPSVYAAYDEPAPDIVLALLLQRADTRLSNESVAAGAGRAGAVAVARAFASGVRRLAFTPPSAELFAA